MKRNQAERERGGRNFFQKQRRKAKKKNEVKSMRRRDIVCRWITSEGLLPVRHVFFASSPPSSAAHHLTHSAPTL